MSNELVIRQDTLPQSVAEITQHAITVQQVLKSVMIANTHYGVIPGTDKPTLYKAGAEVLCMTFRIADEYQVEDLSAAGVNRYRVRCIGRHQQSGVELGSGMGEASTSEEKYRWRKAVCKEEFEATAADMRRTKYGRKQGGFYTTEQVRTESADLANTVLKMACKRAKMAMVLSVTAASDCFAQDLEDLDDTLREHLATSEVPHDPKLAEEWITKVDKETTPESLKTLWAGAAKVIRPTGDVQAFNAVKMAVLKRGEALAPAREPGDE